LNDSPALTLLYTSALAQNVSSVAVLNAQMHPLLLDLKAQVQDLRLVQHFKPESNALHDVATPSLSLKGEYPLILLLPSKDKQQSLAWMALAFAHLQQGGKLLMACENQYGAKSYASALKKLAGHANASSKAKCRIFSACKNDGLDAALQQTWIEASVARCVESHGLWSQAGLFSWKTADVGSKLLLEILPNTLAGLGMDLCCGYGLLAADILQKNHHIKLMHLVEADAFALACAQRNTQCKTDSKEVLTMRYHHLDATTEGLPKKLDWVVCNPPFHRGQTRDVELGKSIVIRACHALKAGGELFLVANRQLPYEAILKDNLSSVAILISRDGFKVLHGKR